MIIHEKVKVPVQDTQAGRVDSWPPPPAPLAELWGGGGGGSGMFPWQDILAGLFGGSVWHIYLAGFHER